MYISTPPSPEVENFQIKIYCPTGDQTPDLLNQRQTCYHLSQRSELLYKMFANKFDFHLQKDSSVQGVRSILVINKYYSFIWEFTRQTMIFQRKLVINRRIMFTKKRKKIKNWATTQNAHKMNFNLVLQVRLTDYTLLRVPNKWNFKDILKIFNFWSVNFFRQTMHSKSPVVNLAERHETLLANKWLAMCKQSIITDI